MKSKRLSSNGGGVEKSTELTEVTRRNDLPYVTFASVIEARREEAKRTIVVQVVVRYKENACTVHRIRNCIFPAGSE